jgi:structural maintenance of chromosome 3 (chondroitin sulfate proteoglycan 6)
VWWRVISECKLTCVVNHHVGFHTSVKYNFTPRFCTNLYAPPTYATQEERQALLHEGSGSTAVSAFVEIVFDNSDHRFSLENSDEVVLRRTIGHKKDEFFLQRKRATKNEIMSLLEGAGFSKSNPYYIVQQGKVNALCTMNDVERLRLLKEVAGTTVYDEKKQESLQKMEENSASIVKIQDVLDTIEARLEELHGEKEELTQYQSLDRQRRAMEYTLYDLELSKARATLDSIESDRNATTQHLSELYEAARTTHDQIKAVESNMKKQSLQLRRLAIKDMEGDHSKAIAHRTQLELECKELQDSLQTQQELEKQNRAELKQLEKKIQAAQNELGQVSPKYDDALQTLQRLETEREEAQKKVEGLYAKQGRGRSFTSVQQRDDYLNGLIGELQAEESEKQDALRAHQDSLANLRRSMETNQQELQALQKDVEKKTSTLQSLVKALDDKKKQRLELHDARKESWRKLETLRQEIQDAREQVGQSSLRKVMPRATSLGLEALVNIVQELGLVRGEQYFGMVMENFELSDVKYQTAVEVAAQNALFHVIVDTDGTAAKLMRVLENKKLGRVTFLPLNRLRVESVTYPDSPDVRPLLSHCLSYDPKIDRAMKHVFGKKLLARNVDVASTWAARSNMDALTLDGDLCSRKGALSGGYIDRSKSRLRAYAQSQEAKQALEKARTEHAKLQQQAQSIDQNATNIMGELQRLEAKEADLNHMLTEVEQTEQDLVARIRQSQDQVAQLEKQTIPNLEREIVSVTAQMGRLRDELGTELTQALSNEERSSLERFQKIQKELSVDIEQQNEIVSTLTVERQRLESLLNDNLLKRRQELLDAPAFGEEETGVSNRRSSRGTAQRRDDLEQRQRDLGEAARVVEEMETRLDVLRTTEASLKAELMEAKNEFEHLKSQDMKNSQALDSAQQQSEKLLNKVCLYSYWFSYTSELYSCCFPALHDCLETRALYEKDPRTWLTSSTLRTGQLHQPLHICLDEGTRQGQQEAQEVFPREQKGLRSVCELQRTARTVAQEKGRARRRCRKGQGTH